MSCTKKTWDSSQLRKYDLNLESIPRLHYKDPKIDELMKENVSFKILRTGAANYNSFLFCRSQY